MGRKPMTQELLKEYIFTALMLLMEKQDYSSITITDISRRAGVSRMTYYRIYHSKDDIIKTKLEEIFDSLFLQVKSENIKTNEEFFTCFFSSLKNNLTFFRNILKADLLEYFWKKHKEYTMKLFSTYFHPDTCLPFMNYKLCFFCGGFMHIAREWLETGAKEDIDLLVKLSCDITNNLARLSPP